ncbi:MAG: hypothetical protein ACP5QS_01420 [bacterium]
MRLGGPVFGSYSEPDGWVSLLKKCCVNIAGSRGEKWDGPCEKDLSDFLNMISCPSRYFFNGDFAKECVEKLGPYIKSCHAKDVLLSDIPLMLEHLNSEEEYLLAGEYLRDIGREVGVYF